MTRAVSVFTIARAATRVRVRLVRTREDVARSYRARERKPLARGEFLDGVFHDFRRGCVGEIVLTLSDLTPEIVAHECMHAALHAERRRGTKAIPLDCDDIEERVVTLAGLLTLLLTRELRRLGYACD